VENKPASADGSLRTLVLSVQDEARASRGAAPATAAA
jgi:hypothetical protein